MTPETSGDHRLDHGRTCLLVTGAPGSGKTTVTRLLARSLSRAALLDGDVVARLVVSGYVGPLDARSDEAARQVALCNNNLCGLAHRFAQAGFTPVIDWVVPDGAQLDVYRRALGSALRVVVLDPGAASCITRNQGRPPDEQFFFDGYDALRRSMHDGFGDEGWWLDTSEQTRELTAREILDGAYDRAALTTMTNGRS